jgi:arylsulfatase
LDSSVQERHENLYWEFPTYGGQQAVRMGEWKAVRTHLKREGEDHAIQLYNLAQDIGETHNLAEKFPEIVEQARRSLRRSRVESELFPFPEVYLRRM